MTIGAQAESVEQNEDWDACQSHLDQVEVGYRCLLLDSPGCISAFDTVFRKKEALLNQVELPENPDLKNKLKLPEDAKPIDWAFLKRQAPYSIVGYAADFAFYQFARLTGGVVVWYFSEPFWDFIGMGSQMDPCEDLRGSVGHYMPLEKKDCKVVLPEFSKELYRFIRIPHQERSEQLAALVEQAKKSPPKNGQMHPGALCAYVRSVALRFQDNIKKFQDGSSCSSAGGKPSIHFGNKEITLDANKSIVVSSYFGRTHQLQKIKIDNSINLIRPALMEKAKLCGLLD